MFDLSFLQIVTRLIAIILVLSLMGFCVAAFAKMLGDQGPGYDGKLTLNPFAHADGFSLIAAVAARVGWIRPINIDPGHSLLGRAAPIMVAVLTLGAIALFGRIVLLALPFVAANWPTSSASFVDSTIRMTADAAAWTVAFNIIPLPPLLGGYVLQVVAPRAHRWLVERHLWASIALTALAILFFRQIPGSFMGDLARALGAR